MLNTKLSIEEKLHYAVIQEYTLTLDDLQSIQDTLKNKDKEIKELWDKVDPSDTVLYSEYDAGVQIGYQQCLAEHGLIENDT